jgi:hypothetical protein
LVCPWSYKKRCWIRNDNIRNKHCPISSSFQEVLKKTILTGRDLQALNMERFLDFIPGTRNLSDDIVIKKADVAVCFKKWDDVCQIIGMSHRAQKAIDIMTTEICRDMIRGGMIFKRRLSGNNKILAETYADKKIRYFGR